MYIECDENGKSSVYSPVHLKTPFEKKMEARAKLAAQVAEEGVKKARNLLSPLQLMMLSSLPPSFMAAQENDISIPIEHENIAQLLHFEFASVNNGYVFRTQKGNSMLAVNDVAPLFSKENLIRFTQESDLDFRNKNNQVCEMSDEHQFNALNALWNSLCSLKGVDDSLCRMSKLFSPVRLFATRVKSRDAVVAECEVSVEHKDDPFVVMLLNPRASTPKAAMARYLETQMKFEHRLMVRLSLPHDSSIDPLSEKDVKVVCKNENIDEMIGKEPDPTLTSMNEKSSDMQVNSNEGLSVVINEMIQEDQGQVNHPKEDVILSMDESSEELLRAMHSAIRSLNRLAEIIEKNQRTQK